MMLQLRENLTIEAPPMRIEDREVNQLCGKDITLVKVAWGGLSGGNITWEPESQMRDSHLTVSFR